MKLLKKIALTGVLTLLIVSFGIASVPSVPELLSPTKGSLKQSTTLFITWNSVAFADGYWLQVSTDSLFGASIYDISTIVHVADQGIQGYQLSGLINNTKFYWRVSAVNSDGWGEFSSVWNFTTVTSPPSTPVLSSPANASIDQPTTIALSWLPVVSSTSYQLQVALDNLFSIIVLDTVLGGTAKTVTGLVNSSTYYWRVLAMNAGGSSAFSLPWKFTSIINAPVLVSPINSSANQSTSPIFKWKAVSLAESYILQITTDSMFSQITFYDSTIPQTFGLDTQAINIGGFSNGTKYYWRVKAQNSLSIGNYSLKNSFTIIVAAPTVPVLTLPENNAKQQSTSATFSWGPVPNATSYRLQISTDSAFSSLVYNDSLLNTASKTITTLANNIKYFWRVNAKNVAAITSFSQMWSFTTIIGSPANISPVNSATNVPVTEMFAWKNVSGAARYELQLSPLSNFSIVGVDDSTITDTVKFYSGLENNTAYFWRVRALGANGWGSYSPSTKFTTIVSLPETPILSTPSDFVVNQPISVSLSWLPVNLAASYWLQVSTDPFFFSMTVNDSTLKTSSKTLSLLKNIQKYYWRVGSKNAAGVSAFSSVWNFTTVIDVPKTFTPLVNAANQSLPLIFQWSLIPGAINYKLEVSSRITFDSLTYSDSTLTDTTIVMTTSNLMYSTKYYWRVVAKSINGWGSNSLVGNFTTMTPIPQIPSPQSPLTDAVNLQLPVQLTWNLPGSTASFKLQVSTDSLFSSVILTDSTLTTPKRTMTALSNMTRYYWRVAAKNITGTSAYSVVWNFKIGVASPVPVAPVSGAVDQILNPTLYWNKVFGSVKYDVQISSSQLFDSFIVNDSLITDTSYTTPILANNTKYFWRVSSMNSEGASPFSAPNNFLTVNPIPGIPSLFLPVNGSANQPVLTTLAWKPETNAAWYTLQVAADSSFTSPLIHDSVAALSKKITMQNNMTYYWRVAACNAGGSSQFSSHWNYSTAMGIPSSPMLTAPENSALYQPTTMKFIWASVPGAESYYLQVALDSLFNIPVYEDSQLITNTATVADFYNNAAYYWKVTAKNSKGTGISSIRWKFSTVLAQPVLTVPFNDAGGQPTNVMLNWNPSAGATKYHVQLAADTNFSILLLNDSVAATSKNITGLQNNISYWWRVRSLSSANRSFFTPFWKFTTITIPSDVPMQVSPQSGSNGIAIPAVFRWKKIPGAEKYHLQVSTDSPFESLVVNDSTITDSLHVVAGLQNSTMYYWRVRAKNAAGSKGYSAIWSFTTILEAPRTPLLISPTSLSDNQPVEPVLKWRKVPTATHYHLQVSSDSPFSTKVYEDSLYSDTTAAIPGLTINTNYFWRVRSGNSGGTSPFSEIWNFKTTSTSNVQRQNNDIPDRFALHPNFPNPFNPSTTISFSLAAGGEVNLTVYDLLGRTVSQIINTEMAAGNYRIVWNAAQCAAGVYFYRISVQSTDHKNDFTQIKKMLLLK